MSLILLFFYGLSLTNTFFYPQNHRFLMQEGLCYWETPKQISSILKGCVYKPTTGDLKTTEIFHRWRIQTAQMTWRKQTYLSFFYDNTWPGNRFSHLNTSKRSSCLKTRTYVRLIPLQLPKTQSFSTSSRLRINKHSLQCPEMFFLFKICSVQSQDEQTSFFILGASTPNSTCDVGSTKRLPPQTCRLQPPCEADAGQGGERESGYKYPPQRCSFLLQKQTL